MNIKVRVSQGLQGEFNNKLGAIYEQEIQKRVDAALEDIADELADFMEQELEEQEDALKDEMRVLASLAEINRTVAQMVIESQLEEIEELDATLEEAEARIDKLAKENAALKEKVAALEKENKVFTDLSDIRGTKADMKINMVAATPDKKKEAPKSKSKEAECTDEDGLDILKLFALIASAVEDEEDM